MIKVKCFAYHKPGHFANQCPNNKKGKGKSQVAASAKVDEFATMFEKELLLFSYIFGIVTISVWFVDRVAWFVDSGASHHMTRSWRDLLTNILEQN